jgi:hypothetical protein
MHKAIEVPQVLFGIGIDGLFSVFSAPYLQS